MTAPVKNDQPAGREPQPRQVAVELGQPFIQGIPLSIALHLQLEGQGVRSVAQAQVHAPGADRVLPLQRPSPVDYTVEEGQHQGEMISR